MDLLNRMKSINPRRTSATAAAAAASGEPRPLPAMPLTQTASTASNDSGGPDANAPHTPDKDDAMSEDDVVLLEDGIDVFYSRAREWSKSARIFVTFVEKKADLEVDMAKASIRVVRTALDALEEQKLQSQGTMTTSVRAIYAEQEAVAMRQMELASKLRTEVAQPLAQQREEHDRVRKRMLAEYEKEKKRQVEQEAQLARLKARYLTLSQAWEKAIHEKSREVASSYKLKLEKRSKEEDEAHTRAKAAEEALVAQVKVVNSGLKDLRRFTSLTQRALDKLVHESDAVFKQVAVRYATLTNAFVEDLPAHTRKLAADASMVDNKDDVRAFVDRTSSGARWYRIPFAFEPYEMDAEAKAYLGTTGEPGAAAAAAAKASEANVVLHKFRKSVQAALCSHCGSVVFTGLQCTECRTVCHKACVEKLKVHCEKQAGPPAPKTFQVIGVPLARQPKSPDHPDIPVLVVTCIRAIVRRGVHHEGLYRVAGIKSAMEKLYSLFEEHGSQPGTVDTDYEEDVHVITGCLKMFFRQLPEPLIPYEHYNAMIVAGSPNKGTVNLEELSRLVSLFPPTNYETLAYLMRHLHNVTEAADVNKMRASNLAIVFGPSLLRSEAAEKDPIAALNENSAQCDVVETLITNCAAIFNRADRLRGKDYEEVMRLNEDLRPRSQTCHFSAEISGAPVRPSSSMSTLPVQRPTEGEDDDDIDEVELRRIEERTRARALEELGRKDDAVPAPAPAPSVGSSGASTSTASPQLPTAAVAAADAPPPPAKDAPLPPPPQAEAPDADAAPAGPAASAAEAQPAAEAPDAEPAAAAAAGNTNADAAAPAAKEHKAKKKSKDHHKEGKEGKEGKEHAKKTKKAKTADASSAGGASADAVAPEAAAAPSDATSDAVAPPADDVPPPATDAPSTVGEPAPIAPAADDALVPPAEAPEAAHEPAPTETPAPPAEAPEPAHEPAPTETPAPPAEAPEPEQEPASTEAPAPAEAPTVAAAPTELTVAAAPIEEDPSDTTDELAVGEPAPERAIPEPTNSAADADDVAATQADEVAAPQADETAAPAETSETADPPATAEAVDATNAS